MSASSRVQRLLGAAARRWCWVGAMSQRGRVLYVAGWLSWVAAGVLLGILASPGPTQGGTREYKIAQSFPFPPWEVGPLEGVSFDVVTAICEANAPMTCQIVAVPGEDCVDTDAEGNAIVGSVLASGEVDACMGWFNTPERERLGAEFGHGYSSGPTPQLIASNGNPAFDTLGGEGSLTQAEVGFIAGFFNDEACLSTAYSDFSAVIFPSDQAGREAVVAALLQGDIDLVFWDSLNTVPAGAHLVGEPIQTCGPALGLLTYPPGTSRECRSDELRRDYNCGLALIRANGVLDQICSQSPHPGGDPACLLEGPAPTVQCVADNPVVPTPVPCVGDCDGDGSVFINELIVCVSIAVETVGVDTCEACDGNGNGRVEITDLITSVKNSFLDFCGA